ncbi:ATP-dependent DNA helicase RecG [Candidatus Palibaumannia cicadellinicola]|uniref:ATP-dependent DNA helicase RecG n=1 Tax=Candidatus Palibaumannia cicadellinicola TaxID=186490 RepID=A0A0K2BJW6_9GAMM|nr:ATP-dependent DNA helicase RecG [Candidatus Baumannia cicadellinicola]AKZ65711.1 ATP-dependent DNA helicase RecG [Candidatus Baumannia cicadellinicola]
MTGYCKLRTIPINKLSGVGPKLIAKLAKLGLDNLQDVLLHLPISYEDRTKLYPIINAPNGMLVTIQGKILDNKIYITLSNKHILSCRLQDNSGVITLLFFNFNISIKKSLSPGKLVIAYGEINRSKIGVNMINPKYYIQDDKCRIILNQSLTPIYLTTAGLGQDKLRYITEKALNVLATTQVAELLPPKLSSELISLSDALHKLHRPPTNISITELESFRHTAQKRLILEELIAYDLSILAARKVVQESIALPLSNHTYLINRFISSLPFSLTAAQKRVIADIYQDLESNIPMMRLVQGDVGSGKTLVAALAALRAISNNSQVAMMTPTELLAEQHLHNFSNWFTPLGIHVSWLTGKQQLKIRNSQLEAIASGNVAMIIGTHAIFQKQVKFAKLALVIIDEQQRFGVNQRLNLWKKGIKNGIKPHQLIMTATPIPRTLAMTANVNINTSVLNELPPGRTPVTTIVVANNRRVEIIKRLKQACLQDKRQVYWVCTIINKSEFNDLHSVKDTLDELRIALPELNIGLVHGRMEANEKKYYLNLFQSGKIQLLVSTTVIEVGIDVPNASMIIIDNPERLGLAQLHQLRGRVGRGAVNSHCVMIYKPPLSEKSKLKLKALRDSSDGFTIAKHDLKIRGYGQFFGTRQTGKNQFRFAELPRDKEIISEVQPIVHDIHTNFPNIAQALIQRWMPQNNNFTYHYTYA